MILFPLRGLGRDGMKQLGFFDVEERLARLSGPDDHLEAVFPDCGFQTSSALTWTKLWPLRMGAKAVVLHLIRF
mgnify:FL=1